MRTSTTTIANIRIITTRAGVNAESLEVPNLSSRGNSSPAPSRSGKIAAHCGHDRCSSQTSDPHSEHFISAMRASRTLSAPTCDSYSTPPTEAASGQPTQGALAAVAPPDTSSLSVLHDHQVVPLGVPFGLARIPPATKTAANVRCGIQRSLFISLLFARDIDCSLGPASIEQPDCPLVHNQATMARDLTSEWRGQSGGASRPKNRPRPPELLEMPCVIRRNDWPSIALWLTSVRACGQFRPERTTIAISRTHSSCNPTHHRSCTKRSRIRRRSFGGTPPRRS